MSKKKARKTRLGQFSLQTNYKLPSAKSISPRTASSSAENPKTLNLTSLPQAAPLFAGAVASAPESASVRETRCASELTNSLPEAVTLFPNLAVHTAPEAKPEELADSGLNLDSVQATESTESMEPTEVEVVDPELDIQEANLASLDSIPAEAEEQEIQAQAEKADSQDLLDLDIMDLAVPSSPEPEVKSQEKLVKTSLQDSKASSFADLLNLSKEQEEVADDFAFAGANSANFSTDSESMLAKAKAAKAAEAKLAELAMTTADLDSISEVDSLLIPEEFSTLAVASDESLTLDSTEEVASASSSIKKVNQYLNQSLDKADRKFSQFAETLKKQIKTASADLQAKSEVNLEELDLSDLVPDSYAPASLAETVAEEKLTPVEVEPESALEEDKSSFLSEIIQDLNTDSVLRLDDSVATESEIPTASKEVSLGVDLELVPENPLKVEAIAEVSLPEVSLANSSDSDLALDSNLALDSGLELNQNLTLNLNSDILKHSRLNSELNPEFKQELIDDSLLNLSVTSTQAQEQDLLQDTLSELSQDATPTPLVAEEQSGLSSIEQASAVLESVVASNDATTGQETKVSSPEFLEEIDFSGLDEVTSLQDKEDRELDDFSEISSFVSIVEELTSDPNNKFFNPNVINSKKTSKGKVKDLDSQADLTNLFSPLEQSKVELSPARDARELDEFEVTGQELTTAQELESCSVNDEQEPASHNLANLGEFDSTKVESALAEPVSKDSSNFTPSPSQSQESEASSNSTAKLVFTGAVVAASVVAHPFLSSGAFATESVESLDNKSALDADLESAVETSGEADSPVAESALAESNSVQPAQNSESLIDNSETGLEVKEDLNFPADLNLDLASDLNLDLGVNSDLNLSLDSEFIPVADEFLTNPLLSNGGEEFFVPDVDLDLIYPTTPLFATEDYEDLILDQDSDLGLNKDTKANDEQLDLQASSADYANPFSEDSESQLANAMSEESSPAFAELAEEELVVSAEQADTDSPAELVSLTESEDPQDLLDTVNSPSDRDSQDYYPSREETDFADPRASAEASTIANLLEEKQSVSQEVSGDTEVIDQVIADSKFFGTSSKHLFAENVDLTSVSDSEQEDTLANNQNLIALGSEYFIPDSVDLDLPTSTPFPSTSNVTNVVTSTAGVTSDRIELTSLQPTTTSQQAWVALAGDSESSLVFEEEEEDEDYLASEYDEYLLDEDVDDFEEYLVAEDQVSAEAETLFDDEQEEEELEADAEQSRESDLEQDFVQDLAPGFVHNPEQNSAQALELGYSPNSYQGQQSFNPEAEVYFPSLDYAQEQLAPELSSDFAQFDLVGNSAEAFVAKPEAEQELAQQPALGQTLASEPIQDPAQDQLELIADLVYNPESANYSLYDSLPTQNLLDFEVEANQIPEDLKSLFRHNLDLGQIKGYITSLPLELQVERLNILFNLLHHSHLQQPLVASRSGGETKDSIPVAVEDFSSTISPQLTEEELTEAAEESSDLAYAQLANEFGLLSDEEKANKLNAKYGDTRYKDHYLLDYFDDEEDFSDDNFISDDDLDHFNLEADLKSELALSSAELESALTALNQADLNQQEPETHLELAAEQDNDPDSTFAEFFTPQVEDYDLAVAEEDLDSTSEEISEAETEFRIPQEVELNSSEAEAEDESSASSELDELEPEVSSNPNSDPIPNSSETTNSEAKEQAEFATANSSSLVRSEQDILASQEFSALAAKFSQNHSGLLEAELAPLIIPEQKIDYENLPLYRKAEESEVSLETPTSDLAVLSQESTIIDQTYAEVESILATQNKSGELFSSLFTSDKDDEATLASEFASNSPEASQESPASESSLETGNLPPAVVSYQVTEDPTLEVAQDYHNLSLEEEFGLVTTPRNSAWLKEQARLQEQAELQRLEEEQRRQKELEQEKKAEELFKSLAAQSAQEDLSESFPEVQELISSPALAQAGVEAKPEEKAEVAKPADLASSAESQSLPKNSSPETKDPRQEQAEAVQSPDSASSLVIPDYPDFEQSEATRISTSFDIPLDEAELAEAEASANEVAPSNKSADPLGIPVELLDLQGSSASLADSPESLFANLAPTKALETPAENARALFSDLSLLADAEQAEELIPSSQLTTKPLLAKSKAEREAEPESGSETLVSTEQVATKESGLDSPSVALHLDKANSDSRPDVLSQQVADTSSDLVTSRGSATEQGKSESSSAKAEVVGSSSSSASTEPSYGELLTKASPGAFNLQNLLSQQQKAVAEVKLPPLDLLTPSELFDNDNQQLNQYVWYLRPKLDRLTSKAQILERIKVPGAHRYQIKLNEHEDEQGFVERFNDSPESNKNLQAIWQHNTLYIERKIEEYVHQIDLLSFQKQQDQVLQQNSANLVVGLDQQLQAKFVPFVASNTVINGENTEDKSSFLASLMLNLALSYTPSQIEMLAYQGSSSSWLEEFGELPHYLHELFAANQAQEFLNFVFAEFILRRRKCTQLNAGDYLNYNQFLKLNSKAELTPIKPLYVFIDALNAELVAGLTSKKGQGLGITALLYLLQSARKYGMSFVVVNSPELEALNHKELIDHQFDFRLSSELSVAELEANLALEAAQAAQAAVTAKAESPDSASEAAATSKANPAPLSEQANQAKLSTDSLSSTALALTLNNLRRNEFIYNQASMRYVAPVLSSKELQNVSRYWRVAGKENNLRHWDEDFLVTRKFYRYLVLEELMFDTGVRSKSLARFLNYDLNSDFYDKLIQIAVSRKLVVSQRGRYFVGLTYNAYLRSQEANRFSQLLLGKA